MVDVGGARTGARVHRLQLEQIDLGHLVRGPLAALKSGSVPTEAPRNLIDFVNGFRHKLFRAGLLAREKLEQAE